MALERKIAGLIARDNFESDVVGSAPSNWTDPGAGAAVSFTVQSLESAPITGKALRAVIGGADGGRDLIFNTPALPANVVVQSTIRLAGTVNTNVQPHIVITDAGWARPAFVLLSSLFATNGLNLGSAGHAALRTSAIANGTTYSAQVRIRDGIAFGRYFTGAGAFAASLTMPGVTTAGPPVSVGVLAVGAAGNTMWYDNFCVYRDTAVTVNNLESGQKIRLGTETAVEVGGVAKLDYTKLFPVTSLEVLDSSNNVIETITPLDGVWGGDVYGVVLQFIAPTLDETIDGNYNVVFTAVPDATAHQLEMSVNGGANWTVLDANITTAPNVDGNIVWPWDTTALGNVDGVQLRARDVAETVDWFYSDLFNIQNVPPIPPEQVPPARKAWAFTMDGHIFYVAGSFNGMTLLYDVMTEQWCRWVTEDYAFWNMHRGVMWRGRVLAADRTNPVIWELDPHTQLDQEALEIARAVTGFQPIRGDQSTRQGSLRMVARQQTGAPVDAAVILRFSDDGGNTWSQPRTLLLSDATERLEFRSLGRLRKPGRIWEITDSGGLIRISGIDSQLEGG